MTLQFKPGSRDSTTLPSTLSSIIGDDEAGDLYLFLQQRGLLNKWTFNVHNNPSTPLFIADELIKFLTNDDKTIKKAWDGFRERSVRQKELRAAELPEDFKSEHSRYFLTYGKWPKRAASKARRIWEQQQSTLQAELSAKYDVAKIRENAQLLVRLANKEERRKKKKAKREKRRQQRETKAMQVPIIPQDHECPSRYEGPTRPAVC